MLTIPGFQLPSPPAIGDVELQQWSLESISWQINYRILNTFLEGLFDYFSSCLDKKSTVPGINCERMRETFTSWERIRNLWEDGNSFSLQALAVTQPHILYQSISDRLFSMYLATN
jgi:hypothetical protein